MDSDPLKGRTLGEFVIRERIGEGGFGAVYRAEQPVLAREAVVKVLHQTHADNREIIGRFMREAKLASRLDHPYAAHVYAFGAEPDGVLWIAMEYVRGTPLSELLRASGPIPLERFVPLLDRICEVVHTAHEAGIVHRDLKPANVMVLARAGRMLPKLLDLGIAKLKDATAEPVTIGPDQGEATSGSIGSPPYMAPEQWVNAPDIDGRADIYALGILAYESLTGRRPFSGADMWDVARAHARKPVPPLGNGLPTALDAVLAHALAKAAKDRFATAIELAQAFREAAGLAEEPETLPQLDETQREVASELPQPLAEAVAALEAARNAHQARDAVWGVAHVMARTLGALALASRTRVGPGGDGDARQTIELLRALRRGVPEDDDWLALARHLTRPFVDRRDAHPIPELVTLFHGPTDELAPLLAVRGDSNSGNTLGDVRALVERAVPALGRALNALSFLGGYRLVVARDAFAESWMGVRRPLRTSIELRGGKPLAPGTCALVDWDGQPLLLLSPMVQAAPPSPGAPDELFFLAGRGRSGALLVSLPQGFERQDETLWDWYRSALLDVGDAGGAARADDRAPYRGLDSFTADDAALFFGREREAQAFVNRLRTTPLLAVVGPSGAGKSSFVQAGVIPLLPSGWRAVTLRPGPRPMASLAAAIDLDSLRPAPPLGETIVLVVDQLEEILTLCLDPAERTTFAAAITGATSEHVRVVLTLRDDFLVRAEQQLPPLRDRLAQGMQLLTTPAPDDLRRILVEPARGAGYDWEDPQLVAQMVDAVAEQPGALALLSFTASRLWELRDRHFKQLPRKAYEAMGGVGGALAQHAEQVLGGMVPEEQRLVREAFRHLVTAEGTRAVLSRAELVQVLGRGDHAEAVMEKLVAARLLVISDAEEGAERVEIVHEALLAAWPRLVGWRREDAEGARLRDQLRSAARQWQERGRPGGLLWRKEALAEYQLWRVRWQGKLTDLEEAFGAASLRDAQRGRRLRAGALAGVIAMLAVGLVVLFSLYRRSERASQAAAESAKEAQTKLAQLFEEQGRQALVADDAVRALAYLNEAFQRGIDTPAMRFMLHRATLILDRQQQIFHHPAAVLWVAWSPDGQRVATSSQDGTAAIWDVRTGKQLVTLRGHERRVNMVEFDPAGTRVVTASDDRTARIWDAASGAPIATLADNPSQVLGAHYSHDGRRILTYGADLSDVELPSAVGLPAARIWDAVTGARIADLIGHESGVLGAAWARDDRSVATASLDHTARLWNAADGHAGPILRGHGGWVWDVSFAPAGSGRVVTASEDKTAKVWGVDGSLIATLSGHAGRVRLARFDPEGSRVLTTSVDKTGKVWDAATGDLRVSLDGHAASIEAGSWSSDGRRVITGSSDGNGKVWDPTNGALVSNLVGHTGKVTAISISSTSRLVATASADGTARLFDPSPDFVASLEGHTSWVWTARFSPSGATIFTSSQDGTVAEWNPRTGARSSTHKWLDAGAEDQFAVLSADGTLLAAPTEGGRAVVVRDLPSGMVRRTFRGHTANVTAAVFRPGNTVLMTASADGTIRSWDLNTGAQLDLLQDGAQLSSLAISADGRLLAAGSDKYARVWDVASKRTVQTLAGHAGGVASVALTHDAERLVTGSTDLTAKVWRIENGHLLASLEGHAGTVNAVAVSPDDALVATGCGDLTVGVWDLDKGRSLYRFQGHRSFVVDVQFDPKGGKLVSAGLDDTARIWDVGLDPRTTQEARRYVSCHVPFTIANELLVSRKLDACSD